MRIQLTKTLPSISEMIEVLQKELSSDYSYKLSGLGSKNILVGKSTLVGAEVSVRGNEVSISASPPSFFAGLLHAIGLTELTVLLIPILVRDGLPVRSTYAALEKEIGNFLVNKYN